MIGGQMENVCLLSRSIRKEYKGGAKEVFDKEYLFFYFYRQISFFPTAVCIKSGISANAVTAFGCLVLILSCWLLYSGWLIGGAALYLLAYIIDFVDGNIARYTRTFSPFGKMIDGLVDSLTFVIFVSLASGLVASGEGLLPQDLEVLIGVVTSFTFLFRAYVHIRLAFVRLGNSSKNDMPGASLRSRSVLIKRILLAIVSGMPVFLLIAVSVGMGSIYLLGYCIFFLLLTSAELMHGLLAIRRM